MEQKGISAAGAVTYWTLAEETDRDMLVAAAEAAGVGGLAPEPRTAERCAREALRAVRDGARELVRPLERHDGYALVDERATGRDLDYGVALRAWVEGEAETLVVEPAGDPREARVREAWAAAKRTLGSGRVGWFLAEACRAMGGVTLRQSGGVYWLPAAAMDRWATLAAGVEAAGVGGRSSVYVLRTLMDEEATRALRDAVIADADHGIEEVRAGLADLERPSALERRREAAEAVERRLSEYERILGETLAEVRARVEALRADVAAAAMAAMAREVAA